MLLRVLLLVSLYSSLICSPARVASMVGQKNTILGSKNFGKKHFIIGYRGTYVSSDDGDNSVNDQKQEVAKKYVKKTKKVKASHCLVDPTCHSQVFFTSQHNINDLWLELIKNAQHNIAIAMFALTDPVIVDQLQHARSRGVEIEIVTDFANMNEPYSKINDLIKSGVSVSYYSAALNPNPRQKNSRWARMHHKFAIFDNAMVANGSTNLTKSGQKDNIENVTVLTTPAVVNDFIQEFQRLRQQSILCSL